MIDYAPAVVVDPLELIPTLPREPITRRDVLLRAAQVIEQKGWIVGANGMHADETRRCILGAVGEALGARTFLMNSGHEWYCHEQTVNLIGVNYRMATSFNDRLPTGGFRGRKTKRSQARVAAVLRSLADGATWERATSP